MMGIDRSIELDDSTFRSVCVMDLNAFGASSASQNRHSSCAGVMAKYHQRRLWIRTAPGHSRLHLCHYSGVSVLVEIQ